MWTRRPPQILALFAMEQPVSLDAEDIRNEKVKVRPLGQGLVKITGAGWLGNPICWLLALRLDLPGPYYKTAAPTLPRCCGA